jgi:flagella basal body P-ring formation protein FlgA
VNLTRLLWAVAVILAVVVAGMVYVDRRGDEPTLTVMVAKQVIPAGTYVRGGTFDLVTVPCDEIEPGTLTDVKYIAYHRVAREIFPGEPFRASDFFPTPGGRGHPSRRVGACLL